MKKIAILIPCYNESSTIKNVVLDFKTYCPKADVIVFDNNSTDGSDVCAQEAGAQVFYEFKQGKGNVIRSMFQKVDADIYVLADGDGQHQAKDLQAMIEIFESSTVDMIVGERMSNGSYSVHNLRRFHNFGNKLILIIINWIFKSKLTDIMSGYRVFSRGFVKNFPILSNGFEIETEMTIFALNHNFVIREVPIHHINRIEGSLPKLNTLIDGFKVLKIILNLSRYTKPLLFFSLLSSLFGFGMLFFGLPVLIEFIETRHITLIPSAIMASGLGILMFLFLIVALLLDSINYHSKMNFLQQYNLYLYYDKNRLNRHD